MSNTVKNMENLEKLIEDYENGRGGKLTPFYIIDKLKQILLVESNLLSEIINMVCFDSSVNDSIKDNLREEGKIKEFKRFCELIGEDNE